MKVSEHHDEAHVLGVALLKIGDLLLVSGASTERIRNTINRISNSFGYSAEMLILQRTLILKVHGKENDLFYHSLKRTLPHAVNFTILSGISRMSWFIAEQKWTLEQVNDELKRLTTLPQYPRVAVLMLVGLAGAAFCRLAGGLLPDMATVFCGTFLGLFVRQEAHKLNFNPYLCVYFAALAASLIAGLASKFNLGTAPEHAFATSVLFLIPGVPLINSFTDIIDGNVQNGLIRGVNGFIISFSIALGLLTSIFICNL